MAIRGEHRGEPVEPNVAAPQDGKVMLLKLRDDGRQVEFESPRLQSFEQVRQSDPRHIEQDINVLRVSRT